jgi:hypothetical protein
MNKTSKNRETKRKTNKENRNKKGKDKASGIKAESVGRGEMPRVFAQISAPFVTHLFLRWFAFPAGVCIFCRRKHSWKAFAPWCQHPVVSIRARSPRAACVIRKAQRLNKNVRLSKLAQTHSKIVWSGRPCLDGSRGMPSPHSPHVS